MAFSFDDGSRNRIAEAIEGAARLANNKFIMSTDYPASKKRDDETLGPFARVEFSVSKDSLTEFLTALEKDIDDVLAEDETTRLGKRKKGRPRKDIERNIAKKVALRCWDILRIYPTKGRSFNSVYNQFSKRGGFFDKVLRVCLYAAGKNVPDETFRLLHEAVDWVENEPPTPTSLYPDERNRGNIDFTAANIQELDKFKGFDYERALAGLTPAQEKKYLLGGADAVAQQPVEIKSKQRRTSPKKSRR